MAYRGQTVDLRAFLRASVASRATMTVSDGVNTSQSSSAVTTVSRWYDSEATDGPAVSDFTVSDNPLRLRVSLDITAGSAVNLDVARLRLILKSRRFPSFEMPQGNKETQYKFLYTVEIGSMEDVWIREKRLNSRMYYGEPEYRIVDMDTTRHLELLQPQPLDRQIRLYGQASPAILSSDDTQVELNTTYLATFAAWRATTDTPLGTEAAAGLDQKVLMWERQWRELLTRMESRPWAGSIRVYDW
jgi:hypothetical protein